MAGDVKITRAEFEAYLELYHPSEPSGLSLNDEQRHNLLKQMLEERLLVKEAASRKLDQAPLLQAKIERYRAAVLAKALEDDELKRELSEDALRAYYEAHRAQMVYEQARVAQMVFLAPAGALADQVSRARERAQAAKKRIDAGEPFEAVAQETSDDVMTRDQGGDLGPVRVDGLLAPLAAEVRAMAPGEVRGPIQTSTGFHIIKLEAPVTKVELSFEEARPNLEAELRERSWEEFKTKLMENGRIQIFKIH